MDEHEPALRDVVVAVLTYGRNEALPALLVELAAQAGALEPEPARVLVVDNNPDGRARELVLAQPGVNYVHEPEPGIAAARNRALEWAGGVGAVVFIDDDEMPVPGWLAALVVTARRTGANAVTGPVHREYPLPPDAYITGMRRWDRVSRATGTPVPAASTANLLLDLGFLIANGLRFDLRFGLTGGSDTLLTKQLIRAGGLLVWCEEAVVTDFVTPERMTAEWLASRGRRVGNTTSRVELELAGAGAARAAARARMAVRGAGLVLAGSAESALAMARRDEAARGWGRWRRARGTGVLLGSVGGTVFDYRRR